MRRYDIGCQDKNLDIMPRQPIKTFRSEGRVGHHRWQKGQKENRDGQGVPRARYPALFGQLFLPADAGVSGLLTGDGMEWTRWNGPWMEAALIKH
ncbi:hypothetical protein KM043_009624 [Ampulex compressa]|nr:hypothetical protein KM043_009624 [Ampulex compressa]